MNAAPTESPLGPLELLVIQPTPFCNIDCSYCYLPNRQSRKRITPEVLERTFANVFSSGLVENSFTTIWHAGEPLVLPPRFYEDVFALLARHNHKQVRVQHSFQTNATLVDDEWCAFIKSHELRIGVSIDGPAFLHDRHRRTRRGEGTHARVLSGIRRLQQHGIPFHVITVLTSASLDFPDELYDFYCGNGIDAVGFNVEEIEGPHIRSSLQGEDMPVRYRRFLDRFFDLAASNPHFWVREFTGALGLIAGGGTSAEIRTHETRPLAIISVDCDGNFSTFSPELLGLPSVHYDGFAIGRVQAESFREAARTERFRAMHDDIEA